MSVEPPPGGPAPPPPGPGVTPPFPAPPDEGRGARLSVGLLVGGLVVLLCCGGGLAACVGLAAVGTRALQEQASAAVRDYLDDVRDGRLREAYDGLCDEARHRETADQFARRVRAEPRIRDYEIRDARLDATASVQVPVTVTRADGSVAQWSFGMEQDGRTGALEVCRVDR